MKIKKYRTIATVFLPIIFSLLFFASCEENPIKSEQYIKQVYIVGAENVVKSFDVKYGNEPQSTYISIACGGSLNMDKDITIKLDHNDSTINWYNNKYMWSCPLQYQVLDPSYYVTSLSAEIKKGDIYGRMPITVSTGNLNCDSLYSITFKIKSVSDYTYRSTDTVLIMNLNFINDYSGTYQLTANTNTVTYDSNGNETLSNPQSLNLSRTLKAVNDSTVRLFNANTTEDSYISSMSKDKYLGDIDNECITLSIRKDGSVGVAGWKNLIVLNPTASYSSGTFTFTYYYMEGTTRKRISGTLVKNVVG